MLRKFAGVLVATALIAGPAFAAGSADNTTASAAASAAGHHATAKHAKSTKHTKTATPARHHTHKHVAHGKLHRAKQVRHRGPATTHKVPPAKTAKVVER